MSRTEISGRNLNRHLGEGSGGDAGVRRKAMRMERLGAASQGDSNASRTGERPAGVCSNTAVRTAERCAPSNSSWHSSSPACSGAQSCERIHSASVANAARGSVRSCGRSARSAGRSAVRRRRSVQGRVRAWVGGRWVGAWVGAWGATTPEAALAPARASAAVSARERRPSARRRPPGSSAHRPGTTARTCATQHPGTQHNLR